MSDYESLGRVEFGPSEQISEMYVDGLGIFLHGVEDRFQVRRKKEIGLLRTTRLNLSYLVMSSIRDTTVKHVVGQG